MLGFISMYDAFLIEMYGNFLSQSCFKQHLKQTFKGKTSTDCTCFMLSPVSAACFLFSTVNLNPLSKIMSAKFRIPSSL